MDNGTLFGFGWLRRWPRPFYGWWMVALGGFLTSLNKTAVNKGFPVFILPVEAYFGVNRATVSLIFSLARAETGPTGPLAGWLVDRFGPRASLFLGASMAGGGFLLLGQVDKDSLWGHGFWAFALIYMGAVTIGSNIGFSYSMAALINNWFFRRKALAMSSFQAIDSLLPALLVGVLAIVIAVWGLSGTFTLIGVVLLATILPLAFLIKDSPESMGLTMDGDPPGRPPGSSRPGSPARQWTPPVDYSVKRAMSHPAFWILVVGTALRLTAKAAVVLHIIPIMVSKGVDQSTAAFVFSLLLFVSVPMFLIIGWLADRYPKNLVLVVASVAGTLSFCLLALPYQSLWIVIGFVLLFAVAEASAPTNWAVVGEYFGRKTFSQLRGYIQLANFPGVLLAPVFVGWWYDIHQNYAMPLWIFAVVFALGALTFGFMRNPQARQRESDALEPERV